MKLRELFEDQTPFNADKYIAYVKDAGLSAGFDERFLARILRDYGDCVFSKPEQPKPEPEAEQDVGFKSLDPYIVGVMRELIKQERERLVRLLRKHHHWAIRELADELERGEG